MTGGTSTSFSKEELEWTTSELRNGLRSIEWDVEDLEETISIVEKNPKKFKITDSDLHQRREFIMQTRATVKDMKNHILNPERKFPESTRQQSGNDPAKLSLLPNGPSKPQNRYTRLDDSLETGNQSFIDEQRNQQQVLLKQQDQTVDHIGGSVAVLKDMGHQIGHELDEQDVMLDDLSRDVDHTESRLDNVMKKMTKVLHMSSDKRQWYAIGALLLALIIIIVLFVVL